MEDLPDDADEDQTHPVADVKRQAKSILGTTIGQFAQTVHDSSQAVPRSGQLTFLPEMEGCEFNPPLQSVHWVEPVHKVEFRVRAGTSLDDSTARGRMSVFFGSVLLADISLRFQVDSRQDVAVDHEATEASHAKPYRKIFASYSHKDLAIVEQFESYVETLGDRYLRDWKELRTGENWNDRLLLMIEEADVFQLFWSTNSMHSPFVRREWEHAISLKNKGPHFVRPTFWETPLPRSPANGLPPAELEIRHFTRLPDSMTKSISGSIDDSPTLLRIGRAEDSDERYDLRFDALQVGRHDDCDIVVNDPWANKRHARIDRSGESHVITDLDSTNGTYINGQRIESRVLREGDRIRIGRIEFIFNSENVHEFSQDEGVDPPESDAAFDSKFGIPEEYLGGTLNLETVPRRKPPRKNRDQEPENSAGSVVTKFFRAAFQ